MRPCAAGVAIAAGVLLAAATSASGARTAADVSIYISLGRSVAPGLAVYQNGDTATIAGRNFAVGIRIRNTGPESASLKFRIELPPGLRWGSDAPDPSEDCTSTESAGECRPVLVFNQSDRLHPSELAWDVVADRAGSYPIRAMIVESSTSDPNPANNAATLTVVVTEASAGGATITASRVSVSPPRPKAGSAVTATVRVLAGGMPVTPTGLRCSGTVGRARLAGASRAAAGKAMCVYRPRSTAKGKTLRGTIAFRAGTANVTRRFSVKLR